MSDTIDSQLLPSKGGSDLFHDGEYYVFTCSWQEDHIVVSPAYGYRLNWGDSYDDKWTYTPQEFVQRYYPGETSL